MDRLAAGAGATGVREGVHPWLLFVAAIVAWRTPAALTVSPALLAARRRGGLVRRRRRRALVELVESPRSFPVAAATRLHKQRSRCGPCGSWRTPRPCRTRRGTRPSTTAPATAGSLRRPSGLDHRDLAVAAAAFMPVIFWTSTSGCATTRTRRRALPLMKEERRRAWQVPKTSAAIRRLEGRYERGGVGRTGRSVERSPHRARCPHR